MTVGKLHAIVSRVRGKHTTVNILGFLLGIEEKFSPDQILGACDPMERSLLSSSPVVDALAQKKKAHADNHDIGMQHTLEGLIGGFLSILK